MSTSAMRPAAEVRAMRRQDEDTTAAVLSDAFAADPVMNWLIQYSGDMPRRMLPFFRSAIKIALGSSKPLIFTTGDGAGAAVWLPPDEWKVSPVDLVKSTPAIVRTFRSRLPVALGMLSVMEKHHPKEPHYYLEFLGARRANQGKGLGGALLSAMATRCDEEGMPAYLENSNPRNEPLYNRHGFEKMADSLPLPEGCPPLMPMWRRPRP
jgi:GNAT superfamily N-acetyltransferase